MSKKLVFLFLLIGIICNAQNTTIKTTENDSILICPFPKNCGYYKGEITENNGVKEANGKGKANFQGNIAEGNWKNNRLDGYGTYDVKNKVKYVGEWKDGLSHGKG